MTVNGLETPYWNVATGERLEQIDQLSAFDQWLDEVYGRFAVAHVEVDASAVLFRVDHEAYYAAFRNWLRNEVAEGRLTTTDPQEEN